MGDLNKGQTRKWTKRKAQTIIRSDNFPHICQ